jgi:hypothetical protein
MLADRREMTKTRGKLIELTKERDKYKDKYIKMIIVDVALIFVVIAMAVIMYTSQLPTVINYENKLQDKYAGWAEELESREAQVKQAEQQYNIKVK